MQDVYNIKYDEEKSFMLTDYGIGVLYGEFMDTYHVWITNGLSMKLVYDDAVTNKGRRGQVKKLKAQAKLDPRNYEFAIFVHKNDIVTYNLMKDNAHNLIGMFVNIHFIDNFDFMSQIERIGALSMEVANFGIDYCLLTKLSGRINKIIKDGDNRKVCVISHLHLTEVQSLLNNTISHRDFLKQSINKGVNYLIYNTSRSQVC